MCIYVLTEIRFCVQYQIIINNISLISLLERITIGPCDPCGNIQTITENRKYEMYTNIPNKGEWT